MTLRLLIKRTTNMTQVAKRQKSINIIGSIPVELKQHVLCFGPQHRNKKQEVLDELKTGACGMLHDRRDCNECENLYCLYCELGGYCHVQDCCGCNRNMCRVCALDGPGLPWFTCNNCCETICSVYCNYVCSCVKNNPTRKYGRVCVNTTLMYVMAVEE